MSKIKILHNPKAGETSYPPKTLISLLEKEGYSCSYASIKEKGWDKFEDKYKMLVVAGGDGSVRTVAAALLQRTLMDRPLPVFIVPLGTANNLSKTLGISQDPKKAISSLPTATAQKLDVGFVEGLGDTAFFLEGMGVGIFPKLMKKMEKQDHPDTETVEEKLKETMMVLEEITKTFEPVPVVITADGTKHEGEYLMVEVMNAKSIGPNLMLAENADPGDGELEVVLIPASQRNKLLQHIKAKLEGKTDDFAYTHLKAQDLTISLPKTDVHVDDEMIRHQEGKIHVYIKKGLLEMMVPAASEEESKKK